MLEHDRRIFPRRRVALKLEARTNTGLADPRVAARAESSG